MAGTEVGSLYYDLNIDDKNLKKQLDSADKGVKAFGGTVEDSGEKLKSSLNKAAVGLAAAGAGLTIISKQATDFTVDRVKDAKVLSREIGVSVLEADKLGVAFKRMGIETEQSSQVFGIFSKNIVAASEGTEDTRLATQKLGLQISQTKKDITETTAEIKKHGDKSGELNDKLKLLNNTLETQQEQLSKTGSGFQKLNINTKDANGVQKNFNTLLFEVADKFKAMPDGIDKTALSMELFGRQGKDLIKILNLGGDGIKDLEDKAEALGLTLTQSNINDVTKYIAAQKEMKLQTDALRLAIGTQTIPVMTAFQGALNDVVQALIGTDGPVKTLTVSVLAFGGPILAAAGGLVAFGANLVTVGQALGITSVELKLFMADTAALLAPLALLAAGLVAVKLALNSVTDAWGAMNDAASSQASLDATNTIVTANLQKQAKSGTAAEQARAKQALAAGVGQSTTNGSWKGSGLGGWLAGIGNAGGTDNWGGGMSWVGEKGPELVNIPRGAQIIPNDISRKIVSGEASGTNQKVDISIGDVYINNKTDADYFFARLDRNAKLESMGVSPI